MSKELPAKPVIEFPKKCYDCLKELTSEQLADNYCPDCKFPVLSHFNAIRSASLIDWKRECERIEAENKAEAEKATAKSKRKGMFI